jgi:hypothetical protein
MADSYAQRPVEAGNRAETERQAAQVLRDLAADRHGEAMQQLSVAAPAGGYGGEQGLS